MTIDSLNKYIVDLFEQILIMKINKYANLLLYQDVLGCVILNLQNYKLKLQTKQRKMGCSGSSQVIENKKVEKVQNIQKKGLIQQQAATVIKQIPERGDSFLIGTINNNQQLFANVKLDSLSVNKMSIPQGFTCYNFSSILEYQKSKYFITGGISHDLTNISSEAYIYDSIQHRVEKVSDMSQARYTHISLYHQEHIYVIGGRYYGDDSKAILSNCQKFNLQKRQWVEVPKMNVNRCTCFGLVWNDAIYVFGGYTGPYQRSTKIQYLSNDEIEWKVLNVELYRGIEGAVILPTNKNQFTIFGGLTNSGPTDSVTSINLKNQTIQSKIKLKEKRSLYKSFYKGGKIYIIGGDDQFTSQIYDITTQKSQVHKKQFSFTLQEFDNFGFSTSTVHIPFDPSIQAQAKSQYTDEIVYIFGTTQQPFILQMNVSIPKVEMFSVPLNLKLYSHQGGVQANKNNFILFGGIEEDSLSVVSSEAQQYDILTNKVKKLANMHQKRYAFTQEAIWNGQKLEQIYVFGGATSNTEGKLVHLSVCQKYSIQNDKWDILPPMPQKLISPMSVVFKNQIFVFGGTSQANTRAQDIHLFNTKSQKWTTIESKLQFGLEASSVVRVSQNEYYLFGGRVSTGDIKGIWSIYFKQKQETKSKKQKQPQYQCIFQQKGQMNEAKSLHKIYKPKHQNFYVIFGGQEYPLSCYRQDNLKEENSDLLINMKDMFLQSLSGLNQRSLKNYLILTKE